jgi:sugar lactone lactonase YvrE
MIRIEVLVESANELGEGPLWDVQEQRLYWIDSLGATVNRCDPDGRNVRTWPLPAHIGSMALREQGGAVLSLRNGFHFLDFDSGAVTPVVDPAPGIARIRMNDGKVDRQGRFVAGYMDYQEKEPLCGLFRLDPDLTAHRLDDGIIVSNGPCWSPDGGTFYFADSWKREIYAYDYDPASGAATGRRPWVSFADLPGIPDGATVDAEGFVWSAAVYAGQLLRFAPDGRLDRAIGLPVQAITSIMFGGPDLDIAYVTSMARRIDGVAPREREAGHLFAVHGLGVRGLPEPRFKG